MEIAIKVREYSSGEEKPVVDARFTRRSFDKTYDSVISLTAGVKTEIKTNISTIEFVYVHITGDATDVSIYQGNSPELWGFDDTFMVFGITGLSAVSLMSDADTTVEVFLGGS